MAFTQHPKAGTSIKAGNMAQHLEDLLDASDRHVSGFGETHSGGTITITSGRAIVDGFAVGKSTDSDESLTFTDEGTHHIFLNSDGSLESNTTGAEPTNAIKLWEAEVDSNGDIIDTTDRRDKTVDLSGAPLSVRSLDVSKGVSAETAKLIRSEPYIEFEDTSDGTRTRLRAVGGALEVFDPDTNTVLTGDLRNVATSVGSSVENSTSDEVLFIDSSGLLAQNSNFRFVESTNRLNLGANTEILFGGDTTLRRSGQDQLKTDDSFDVVGTLSQGGTPVVLETRTVSSGTGLTGGGDLSADQSFSLDESYGATWTTQQTFSAGILMGANLNFDGNEAVGMVIENRSSDPSSPVPGEIWYRTDKD